MPPVTTRPPPSGGGFFRAFSRPARFRHREGFAFPAQNRSGPTSTEKPDAPYPSSSIFIETYGCAFNLADEEALAGVLSAAGYRIVTDPAQADLLILNTCTVKDRTFRDFEKRLRRLKLDAARGAGPRLIVAGCIPKAHQRSYPRPLTSLLEGVSTLGPETIGRAAEVAAATLRGEVIQAVRPAADDPLTPRSLLPVRRRNPVIGILPIASGCLSACSFCQTRLARGRLHSFRPGDILERARQAIGQGVRQLWVTAQDAGAYGQDCDYPLPRLLRRLCELEGDFMIRLGMSSPVWITERLDEYLELFQHPKMFQFLHAPLQSGSDSILRAMRRAGTAAQFAALAEAFHARLPDATLMTDVIVGFPGETDEDFAATLALLDRAAPAAVNRSRFSARPGTPAALLSPLPGAVVARRAARLNDLARALARDFHRRWVGRRDRVLTAEAPRSSSVVAYNRSWRPVDLAGPWPLGVWVDVEIEDAADYHLLARPLQPPR